MAKETFTVRAEPASIKKLDWLAAATDRSRNYLVNEAIKRFLAEEAEFVAAVHRGLEDAKAGRTTPHDEVFAKLNAKIEAKINELER